MKTTVKRGAALARGHMRKVSTRSSNTSPPCAQEGGGGVEYILQCGQSRYKCPPFVASCSYASFFLRLLTRVSSQDVPASRRSRGGWEVPRERPPPSVNVDREKLLLFVYTGMRDGASYPAGSSSLCRLADNCPYKPFRGSGCRSRRRFIWRGGHSSVDLWPSPPHPLAPATPRRNESC